MFTQRCSGRQRQMHGKTWWRLQPHPPPAQRAAAALNSLMTCTLRLPSLPCTIQLFDMMMHMRLGRNQQFSTRCCCSHPQPLSFAAAWLRHVTCQSADAMGLLGQSC